jgi:ankyrin repeat protein
VIRQSPAEFYTPEYRETDEQSDESVLSDDDDDDDSLTLMEPIAPNMFLLGLLLERGYTTSYLSPWEFQHTPSSKEVEDYSVALVSAIKNNDLEGLQNLKENGVSMNACNRFGESVLHLAARRSSVAVVQFLLDNGASPLVTDDLGRTPLHDACWATTPRLDIAETLLNVDRRLLRVADKRGLLALEYVSAQHYSEWCAFFNSKKELYWAHDGVVIDWNQVDDHQFSPPQQTGLEHSKS